MVDKNFIDTNILIYAFSSDELNKKDIASGLIGNSSIISKQVVNELCNIFLKKFKLSPNDVENAILELDDIFDIVDFDLKTQIKALKLKTKYNLQFYDALIVATALENKCEILYSEDMQHNILIEDKLRIINPFI
jgi:predicted nucleic acid-binding protein